VQVGLEEVQPRHERLALSASPSRCPEAWKTKGGRVGPLRMHYERVMGAVLHMSRALESVQL